MKHTLLFIPFLILSFSVSAQDYLLIDPVPAVASFSVDLSDLNHDLEIEAEVHNISGDTLLLKWVRVILEQPEGWDTQVCDPNACYLPFVDTNFDPENMFEEPVIVAPDSSFPLIFHVLPNGFSGEGSFEVAFSLTEKADSIIATAAFQVTVAGLASSDEGGRFEKRKGVRVFPNPAVTHFELMDAAGIDHVTVYNLLGRPVRQFVVMGNYQRYDISGLPSGVYLISFQERSKGIVQTSRLIKRSLMP